MPLLNIYFPSHWWDIGGLVLSILILPAIIRKALLSMKKAMDLPYIMVLLLLIVITIIWFLIAKAVPFLVEQIDWSAVRWWYWVIGIALLLAIIFRKSLFSKIPTIRTPSWSWPMGIVWALVIAFIAFYTVPRVTRWWKSKDFHEQYGDKDPGKAREHRPMLLTEGTDMIQGQWYEYYQDKGKLWNFQPTEPGKIVYKIVKIEDETRQWRVEVLKEEGKKPTENRLNRYGIEPNKEAKVGRSLIMLENTSARVIAVRS